MTTTKPRINITIEDSLNQSLNFLAKKWQVSVSKVAVSLLNKAISLEEDLYFSEIADKRYKNEKDKPLISHEDAWK